MTHPWPLFDFEITTSLVSMRLPNESELLQLASVAAAGVHEPGEEPFLHPWTSGTPQDRERVVLQRHWRGLGRWAVQDWSLNLCVFVDDEPVGSAALHAADFTVVREVSTSSWLGLPHHGKGIGTHARTGLLALAFDALGAESARTDVFQDNHASRGVSRKLGYESDGISRDRRGEEMVISDRLRLSRTRWRSLEHPAVEIAGFEACRPLFGL